MKLSSKLLAAAAIAATTFSMTSCSAPPTFSYKNVSIAITSFCSDCTGGVAPNYTIYNPAYPAAPSPGSVLLVPNSSEGSTVTLTATVTNAPQTNVTWTIYPQGNLSDVDTAPSGTSTPVTESSNPMGTIQAASANTIYYTIPGVPIYSGAALVQANQLGIPQGDILIVASVPSDPSNPSVVTTQSQLIQTYGLTTPTAYLTPHTQTTPSGQVQPVVTVPRNTSFAFYGGTAGALPCFSTAACGSVPVYTTDNTSVWEVGPEPFSLATGIMNGNATYGTITQQGVYTAPAVIPTTTNSSTGINGEVTVIVTSHSAPSINSYAYVAIN